MKKTKKDPALVNRLNIALSKQTSIQAITTSSEGLRKTIARNDEDVSNINRENEVYCNNVLINNATVVLHELLQTKEVKEYMESVIGKHDGSPSWEHDIFVVLAEEGLPSPATHEDNHLPIGRPISKNRFQLVLKVHRSMESGYEWGRAEIEYTMYSIDNILVENWMDATPVNLSPSVVHALLYLQTPETAIQILATCLGVSDSKIHRKERQLLKIKLVNEGGKKS